jgi:hypothetical protein
MEIIRRYRATARLCRLQAMLHPEELGNWLADAERWDRLADAEVEAHFRACNTGVSSQGELVVA